MRTVRGQNVWRQERLALSESDLAGANRWGHGPLTREGPGQLSALGLLAT